MRLNKTTLAALLAALCSALLLPACSSPGLLSVSYSTTFHHAGHTYAVTDEIREGTWSQSLDFCASLGDGWRLPTLEEAIAMRNDHHGPDPLDFYVQPICQGYPSMGAQELWTSTTCEGTTSHRRAYTIHPNDMTIVSDYVEAYCHCENNSPQDHWCCLRQQGYGVIHACPHARCIRALDPPTSTPEPTPTPTVIVKTVWPTATPTRTPPPTHTIPPSYTPTVAPTATPTEVLATSTPFPSPTAPHSPLPDPTPVLVEWGVMIRGFDTYQDALRFAELFRNARPVIAP